MREVCGECKYSKFCREEQDFVCTCEDSDNYGLETEYSGNCECFEEKE